jgi:sortase A
VTVGRWLAAFVERALLGFGVGCLATYGYVTVDAYRFHQEQVALFERGAAVRASATVKTGALLGMLDVPRLKLSTPVIEGDDTATLKRSVGHLPDTPLPWQDGNAAIAGHRDGLFRPLKDVAVGDEIQFRTTQEAFRYRVTATTIVMPDDLSVLESRATGALTLITCYPFNYVGAAPKRFVVHAERLPAH